jgi:hypothetical protein
MTTTLTRRSLWILAAALVGALIALALAWQAGLITRSHYIAVYLQTGDIYFGKQVGLWGFTLENVWFFERRQDGSLALIPLSGAAWHPSEPIHINRDQVVFWTYLDPEGQVAQAIAGAIRPAPSPEQMPPSPSSATPKSAPGGNPAGHP